MDTEDRVIAISDGATKFTFNPPFPSVEEYEKWMGKLSPAIKKFKERVGIAVIKPEIASKVVNLKGIDLNEQTNT